MIIDIKHIGESDEGLSARGWDFSPEFDDRSNSVFLKLTGYWEAVQQEATVDTKEPLWENRIHWNVNSSIENNIEREKIEIPESVQEEARDKLRCMIYVDSQNILLPKEKEEDVDESDLENPFMLSEAAMVHLDDLVRKILKMKKPLGNVCVMAAIHGMGYDGPSWEPELTDAIMLLEDQGRTFADLPADILKRIEETEEKIKKSKDHDYPAFSKNRIQGPIEL